MRRRQRFPIDDISYRGWLTILVKVFRGFSRHEMTVSASAISFLALFATLSTVSAFVAFYGLFADPQSVVDDMSQLQGFVPADVVVSMIGEMHSVATHATATLIAAGTFSLLIALWCAQQGVATLMVALNIAYRQRMTDGPWRHLIKSLLVAIGLIVGLLLAAVLAIGLPVYAHVATGALWVSQLMRAGGMAVAGVLLFFGLAALYRWVPDRRPPHWPWAAAGAAVVVAFWSVASIAFSVFLSYADSYVAMYGSLSGVVLLLTLTYVTVATVLLGAEFNAELEHYSADDAAVATEPSREQPGEDAIDRKIDGDPDRSKRVSSSR